MSHPHILAEVESPRCTELRDDLKSRQALCSLDELRVLRVILGRLELGRQRYGYLELSRETRDWKREEAEEHIDAAVYRACDELDRETKEQR